MPTLNSWRSFEAMRSTDTNSRWIGSSSGAPAPMWLQKAEDFGELLQAQSDMRSAGTVRRRERPQPSTRNFANGLTTNGVAIIAVIAAASVVSYGVGYQTLSPQIDLHIGDNRTALSGVAQVKLFSAASSDGAWANIYRSMDQWAQLHSDWDGEGAAVPTPFAISSARCFLNLAMDSGSPPPRPFIASDGEIGFRWKKGEAFASVSFLDDGHIVVFCIRPEMTRPIKIDEPYNPEMDLEELFRSLSTFV